MAKGQTANATACPNAEFATDQRTLIRVFHFLLK